MKVISNVVSKEVKRGEIWFVDFGVSSGRIQGGSRPAIITSNQKCNSFSPVLTVIALTSNVEKALTKKLPTQVFISKKYGVQADSIALCEQPRPADKSQLQFKVGELDNETMILIERALMVQVGIKQNNICNSNIKVEVKESIDMNIAKTMLSRINELIRIQKSLAITIQTLVDLKIEFRLYCDKFGRNHTDVIAEINGNKVNKKQLVMA